MQILIPSCIQLASPRSIQFSGYLRIPHFPHFSTGYLDTNFFVNGFVRKLVIPKKNWENGMNQNVSHFPPFFHKVYSIMVTKICLML